MPSVVESRPGREPPLLLQGVETLCCSGAPPGDPSHPLARWYDQDAAPSICSQSARNRSPLAHSQCFWDGVGTPSGGRGEVRSVTVTCSPVRLTGARLPQCSLTNEQLGIAHTYPNLLTPRGAGSSGFHTRPG